MRRQRARARADWYLHRRGYRRLSIPRLRTIGRILNQHHSRDVKFLSHIGAVRAIMEYKPDPWRCRFCMRMVKGTVSQCGGCHRYWAHCNDSSYVHQPHRRAQEAGYASGWTSAPWQGEDYGWEARRPKSPRKRTQSPRQRQNRSQSRARQQQQPAEETKGKGKGKEPMAPLPPSTQWLAPPALPSNVDSSASESIPSQTATALPSMQPFPKPKNDKDEMELTSLRKMYKDLKGKSNLPEDVKAVLISAEATLRKEDAKSHKQLVGLLKAARKKLADLDEQWEAYRVQWAAYIDKASQMWLSHVESFEHGEGKFAEKRQEALQHLQQTRARLHEIHMRTMEEGSSLEGAQVENAQEALDATMKLDEQDGSEVESNFTQLKADLTGVVKQVKDTIEEKLSKRRRLTPPRPADLEDVEVVEPGDKRTRDSN